jgi:Bcr/CflA subfamily drug resistance transporter
MNQVREPKTLLLAILAALPSIYAVLFTPALPLITKFFGITVGDAQQSMTAFLLGYAFGQLPYGPLSNRFGRKPVFFIGMTVAIFSSLLCIVAGHLHLFWLFVIARFLMACGACVGLNIAYTIIGDLYNHTQAMKVLSFIMLLSAVIPGVATFTGGVLTDHFGWEGCFYFLAFFGLVVAALAYFLLPETSTSFDPQALKIRQIFSSYINEFSNKPLVLAATITGCGAGMIYLFASSAPFIGINIIKLTPEQYGFWALIPALGLLSGSIITRRLASSFSSKQLLNAGSITLIGISLIFLALYYFKLIYIWSLFFPMMLVDTCLALIFTTTAAIALTSAKNKSIGSSLMSFINLSLCVLSVFILGMITIQDPIILPLLFCGLSGIIFFLIRRV